MRPAQIAVFQHSLRTRAAAQETVALSDPVLEFLGVNNGMQTVRGVMHVAADADLVYSILTDYDNCARVFRNVVTSETMFTADGDKQVLQACQWQVIGLKGTFNVQLNVEEDPTCKLLVFRLRESSFMRDFEGRWQVEAAPGGGCRIEHILAVKPVMEIPPAIAPYTSSIFKQQVGKLLQDLERAISKEVAAITAAN
jgi:ribosome-associated toxin RatA of RatAB toxin-antitoxin module